MVWTSDLTFQDELTFVLSMQAYFRSMLVVKKGQNSPQTSTKDGENEMQIRAPFMAHEEG